LHYAEARFRLEAAYALGPQQRPTRQLLGEVYAISGEADRAILLWQSVDTGQGQLDSRRWWYQYIGAKQELERVNSIISRIDAARY
jgi:hypothetical protein